MKAMPKRRPSPTGGAHEKYLAQLDEFKGTKVVALTTHGPGPDPLQQAGHKRWPISTASRPASAAAFPPMSGPNSVLIGIQVPAPKVYETLSSGAADAVAMNMGERLSFKLNEVAKNVYEMPGGLLSRRLCRPHERGQVRFAA
jgi:hypothetical protein